MWLVGQNGEFSHTAQRAIAHHSLPRLATVGASATQSATGSTHGQLSKNGAAVRSTDGNQRQMQQDGMCLWSA